MNEHTITIGMVHPAMLQLTEMGQQIVLESFKMAYLHRYLILANKRWQILEITLQENGTIQGRIQEQIEEQAA